MINTSYLFILFVQDAKIRLYLDIILFYSYYKTFCLLYYNLLKFKSNGFKISSLFHTRFLAIIGYY